MLENFWILILFPLLGAFVTGLFGKRLSPSAVSGVACGSVFLSFLVSFLAFLELVRLPEGDRFVTVRLFTWIEGGSFVSDFAFLLDPLSMVMILIVTGVGFLIHVYSIGYMAGEAGYYRYFSYLNLFIFMMSVLVLGNNFLLMFVGWEGVGLCSFLLIGYYFEQKSAGDAAKKAFIVNRIGDVGFLLGVFLIFKTFGSIEYLTVFGRAAELFPEPEQGFGVLSAIAVLLFIGAAGKSAQIPLYVWLPDAMAGPTPVSALIHAATMVTAGVYMIARSSAIYSRAPDALFIVAAIGVLTALLAALIAIAQRDIKKVLAYSTVSQLGYMFLAVGVGAFGAGIFHLMTHAFFKALLFLGSGSVILALHHEQDLFRMGRLRKYLPVTFATMWIGTLAIAGFPGLAGFFSKDEILWKTLEAGHVGLWAVGMVVAGLTAFYMFRMMFLAFHADREPEMGHHHGEDHHQGHQGHEAKPHEPPRVVTVPLVLLAFFSVVAGYVGLPPWLGPHAFEHFLEPSFGWAYTGEPVPHDYTKEILLALLAVVVAAAGALLAYQAYVRDPELPSRVSNRAEFLYRLVRGKFYVDEIYDRVFVHPVRAFSSAFLWRVLDVRVIDGLVNGTAAFFLGWGQLLRRVHSGFARSYALWILGGAVVILLYYYLNFV